MAALVRQFKGSLAAEHGVGIARTEYHQATGGRGIYELMRQIKQSFDPFNLFNPGKIISDGRYKIDSHLRLGAGYALKVPFEPVLAFAAKDGSFTANLEQCNGCGGCRKLTPTMCPTFMATGEEIMSTRGRANAIRAALELRGMKRRPAPVGGNGSGVGQLPVLQGLRRGMSFQREPGPVEGGVAARAHPSRTALKLRERVISSVDSLGRLGCKLPRLANLLLQLSLLRQTIGRLFGVTTRRPLPQFALERFDHWFAKRPPFRAAFRGRVMLWDDTFVRYHEPHVGWAAVKVLEAAGFEVVLPVGRKCCGRPAFSQGNLDEAARLGRHNLALLNQERGNTPIIFLEPSCYSMFVQDYRELKLPDLERVAARCILFEQFIDQLLEREPHALTFNDNPARMMIHVHCHAKSLANSDYLYQLATRLPQREVTMLEAGCCGMAGIFGMKESKYELSVKVAEPLIQVIRNQPFGNLIVASGTSCRQQIQHLALVRTLHMAEVLAEALV